MKASLTPVHQGALAVATGALMFSCMGAGIKALSDELPFEVIIFFRNLLALLAFIPLIIRHRVTLATNRPYLHLFRCSVGLGAMYCFFYAINVIPLAEAVLFNFMTPIFLPVIAWMWLREPVSRPTLVAITIGFLGVVVILRPGLAGMDYSFNYLIALFSGFFAAVAMVAIRKLSTTEPMLRIVFYFSLLGTLVTAVPLFWTWQTPTLEQLSVLVAIGLFATGGQLAITKGYSMAPAAQIGPLSYLSIVFSGLFGWLLWGENITAAFVVGALLVFGASVMALRSS